MKKTKKAGAATSCPTPCKKNGAKVVKTSDTCKRFLDILQFFSENVGSVRECAEATGCDERRVREVVMGLRLAELLFTAGNRPNKTTRKHAFRYTTDIDKAIVDVQVAYKKGGAKC